MYRKILAIHLCSALLTLAFLAMYQVSAVQMAHPKWFRLMPEVTEQSFPLQPGGSDARIVARQLPLRGELSDVKAAADALRFRVVRPGTVYQVEYAIPTGQAKVSTSTAGTMGMLNRLHHVHGIWHDYPLLNVWAWILGIVSMALLTVGATGLYLWFKNHAERRIGMALLACGAGMTVALIISMRS